MTDLRTTYMGLALDHPVVASAGPLSKDLDGIKRLEDGGAAAIVLFSLFEEQIRHEQAAMEHFSSAGAESFAESLSYFPDVPTFRVGPDRYLELVRRARESTDIPIIASLNGATESGWTDYARLLQKAGASAIELNVHFVPTDPDLTGAEVEERYVSIVCAVKAQVDLRVAVKVSPYFTAVANVASRLVQAGADALVLFNRFHQPDFDVERREVAPSLRLSSPEEIRLPLLWLGVLSGRLRANLAASTGVDSHQEVVKCLAAGADVVMTTSSLLRHGPARLATLRDGLADWLAAHDYASVTQLRGSMSQRRVLDPSGFERANYVRTLEGYENPFARQRP
jgi:dihydroorotate dehydrogenase (fumarate)